ncbi:MAG: 2-hydroxyacyl-CoA dehydratase [Ruminococcus sp.]|uniref:2-hydroxyacyl-CoA dehydratase n=1 Tax=Ruminococcus sp. TaxID=41978 RepID=UPI0025FF811C|nr:2-hydroxyacyl-CoA dehydratase [Ruminococcus sp.]MBR0528667.1 2-hydroxyacyl-CoA dehydratase [Ruminococcus sp.]
MSETTNTCNIPHSGSDRVKKSYFDKSKKADYLVLVPDMLPIHFKLIMAIYEQYGYHMELLQTSTRSVIDEGLKNVHNDTCYPALLVIGQFLDALNSGKYDPDHTALLISQTGGGCRASNYIHLLRKALSSTYPQVPVLSLNFSGLEKDASIEVSPTIALKLIYAVLYGDMLMLLYNQCKPYEITENSTDELLARWQHRLGKLFHTKRDYMSTARIYRAMLKDFAALPRTKVKKPKVGIVGEIYVKYSPLANNHLNEFLLSEGCEPNVPGLLDFVMYCASDAVNDSKLYNNRSKKTLIYGIGYDVLYKFQKQQIKIINEHGVFQPPHDFEHLRACADKYINQGVKMGEGWLITAEMAALAETGTKNIICTQPFGCLPNHIVAKGSARVIKKAYPDANIVAIDYDPGATKVNQENRIKLMLANAVI